MIPGFITLHTIAGNQVCFRIDTITQVFQALEQETTLIYVSNDPEPIHCQESFEEVMQMLEPTGLWSNKDRVEPMEIARPENEEESDD